MNVCYICNQGRSDFEREGHDFKQHIKGEHNMWDYLKFIIHLKCKDKGNFNGLEDFVANALDKSL